MCLQEVKCSESKLPLETKIEGYYTYWCLGKYAAICCRKSFPFSSCYLVVNNFSRVLIKVLSWKTAFFKAYITWILFLGSKEGYAGVGLYSKVKPITVKNGLGKPEYDSEGRVITAEYDKFFVVTTCEIFVRIIASSSAVIITFTFKFCVAWFVQMSRMPAQN